MKIFEVEVDTAVTYILHSKMLVTAESEQHAKTRVDNLKSILLPF